MNLDVLMEQLQRDEGLRLKPYIDTVGKTSIGWGRNLSDCGISSEEALVLLQNDVLAAVSALNAHLPWWTDLPESQQQVLANLCFNMGIGALLTFHTFLGLVQQGRYSDAADDLLRTLWASQVGQRANRLAAMMRTGGVTT